MTEVEDFLGQLLTEGSHHSEGAFTINLEKAREKLQEYRLPSADHYILSLLTAAVCSDATFFSVTRRRALHSITFDGRPFRAEELKDLFESMLIGGAASEPRMRELGLAVQGARGLRPLDLKLVSGDKEEAVKLSLDGQVISIEPFEKPVVPFSSGAYSTAFSLRLNHSLLSSLGALVLGLDFSRESSRLLQRHGRYAGLKVDLNGAEINNRRLGPWVLAAKLEGSPKVPTLTVSGDRVFTFQGDGTVGGYLGFAEDSGAWLVVLNGVTYQLSTEHSAYPTSRAVVYAEGLDKDLSGGGLVRNRAFELFTEQVDNYLDKLVLRAASTSRHSRLTELLNPLLPIARARAG